MVSIAVCGEMETEPCCEEHEDPAVAVHEAIPELSDRCNHTELPCGPVEKGDKLQSKKQDETASCARESKSSEVKSPKEDGGEAECKERRKLKKTNSWKMVRFQDPSAEHHVLERDMSAESLFPEYPIEEWTSATFEELFIAEDWQDITGENITYRLTSVWYVEAMLQTSPWTFSNYCSVFCSFWSWHLSKVTKTWQSSSTCWSATCRLTSFPLMWPCLLPSCRRPAAEEACAWAWGPADHATHLGPGSYCEDAVCPGWPHCGGERLQACVCHWRRGCNPGA